MAPEAFARNFDTNEPTRYPDPDIVALDGSFKSKLGNTPIERLYTGTYWSEGCAWSGVGKYVVWSDIPRSENLRYIDEDGHVSRQHRYPSNHSNGNTFDFQGRQISFCHEPAMVIRYEWDGDHHGPRRQLRGRALQRLQRRHGASGRRLHLVHRPRLRRAHELRGQALQRRSAPVQEGSGLPHRRPVRRDHHGDRRAVQAQRHVLQPRLHQGLHRRHRRVPLRRPGRHPGSSGSTTSTAPPSRTASSSATPRSRASRVPPASTTASAATRAATSGRVPAGSATAMTAST